MKKYFLIIILTIISVNNYLTFPQIKFSAKSDLIRLNIKTLPPDTVSPFLTVNLPNVKEGFAINHRDSIFFINGLVNDNLGKTKIFINNNLIGAFQNGQYSTSFILNRGENLLTISAIDKRNNKSEKKIRVNYDPRADVNPPQIKLLPPFEQINRGIQVITKPSAHENIILTGKCFDENEILEIKVNDVNVDSIIDGKFYFNLGTVPPDSLVIFASDVFGNFTEITAEIKFEDANSTLNEITEVTYHAILIGVEDYADQRINNLDYPIRDVENLKRVLTDNYQFEKNNVIVLKNPKRTSVISAFQKLREKLTEKDNLLIFFAGHGYFDPDQDMGYWLPADAVKDDYSNWLPNSTIRDFIRAINTKHTLLISDACFAGSIFSSREPFNDASRSILEIYKIKSRKAMTSGVKNQKVQDRSKFTEFIIKFLLENKNKFLTTQELFTKIRAAVLNNTNVSQTPEYGSIPFTGDEGLSGDFIFIHK
ncbi:Caspase domain protein [Ignavibacterium album JCM 16511]|uniref:Caspase domain protein n=1 Tax=Ignavibacterium album (strain DSM 19864 / JCM 16511 / NBRC 101810 / Mat9-16) TaxID=945713 RepID=I0AI71_IGNAJ|nr:caspase family protein [Ignavibacterium album]AFH48678.1 Caspase domain protein [Ignavibacterium album JCM 16511]